MALKFKLSAAGRVADTDLELSMEATFSALFAAVTFRPLTFFVLMVISFLLITFILLFCEALLVVCYEFWVS